MTPGAFLSMTDAFLLAKTQGYLHQRLNYNSSADIHTNVSLTSISGCSPASVTLMTRILITTSRLWLLPLYQQTMYQSLPEVEGRVSCV